MILEHVESMLRAEAEAMRSANPWRASAMGHCIRKGCFEELGVKPEPLQPRRLLVMKQGTSIHDFLLLLLKKAMGWRIVPETELGGTHYVEIDGEKISFHPDAIFEWDEK